MRSAGLLLLLCLGFAAPANAVLRVDIVGGTEARIPIMIMNMRWYAQTDTAGAELDIAMVVRNDLYRSGLFEIKRPTGTLRGLEEKERWQLWRKQGAESVLTGHLESDSKGGLLVKADLIDTVTERKVEFRIETDSAHLRNAAHYLSNEIYQRLTGRKGPFGTRIAFVRVFYRQNKPTYMLLISDDDGANVKQVASSSEPILSPAWSANDQQLAYVGFEDNRSTLFIQNLTTGERTVLSNQPGVNGSPAWSPDGAKIALTLSENSNLDIYTIDLATREKQRITYHTAIDTEAEWSPDGSHLVFTSDRGGNPQIYKTDLIGGQPVRLTYEGHYNTRPRYSPDGKHITMVHGWKKKYRIGLLDLDNQQFKLLSKGSQDESPDFSPSGDMIVFSGAVTDVGELKLITGSGHEIVISRPPSNGTDRDPVWSGYLH